MLSQQTERCIWHMTRKTVTTVTLLHLFPTAGRFIPDITITGNYANGSNLLLCSCVESGNSFTKVTWKTKSTWTNAPWIGSRLKNNSIVHKQRGLIRAGGSSFSKASKHSKLARPSPNDLCGAPLWGKIPDQIRCRETFLEIFYAFYQSGSWYWIARVWLLYLSFPVSFFLSSSHFLKHEGVRKLWSLAVACVMTDRHRRDSS